MVSQSEIRMLAETPHNIKFIFTLQYLFQPDGAWLNV